MAGLIRWAVVASVAGFVAGCAGSAADRTPRAAVSGSVTVDGQPLERGVVMFDPQNGTVPTTLDVVNGKFAGEAPVGKNRVEISAPREVAMEGAEDDDGAKVQEETLPAEYNAESTLTKDVTEGGPNTFDFELKTR